MRYFSTLLAAAVLAIAPDALAGPVCATFETPPINAADISAGAVVSSVFPISSASQVDFGVDVTDANDGITEIKLTFDVAFTPSGQLRAAPDCTRGVSSWTCIPLALDWDPQASGKNYEQTAPVSYAFMRITATPIGHGAGDVLSVDVRVCQ